MKIVDFTAGKRAVWLNKEHDGVVFLDKRLEVNPSILCDSTNTQLETGAFDLAVFDPPHVNFGKNARMSKNYGHHTTEEINDFVTGISREAHRLVKPGGLMAFKWNDHSQRLEKILSLMLHWTPLFGHVVSKRKSTRSNSTYWVLLARLDSVSN